MSILDDLIGEISSIRASVQGDVGEFFQMREKLLRLSKSTSTEIVAEANSYMPTLESLEADVAWMVQTLSEISGFPEWQTAIDISSVYARMRIFMSNVKDMEDRAEGTIPWLTTTNMALIALAGLGVLLLMGMRK